jgi:hypothetical protein
MADCLSLLETLMADSRAPPFNDPVDYRSVPELSHYPMIVEKPLDLGTVRGMLLHNTLVNPEHFRVHATLVFENALLFNRPDSIIAGYAAGLLLRFTELWEGMLEGWRAQARAEREEKLALQRELQEWQDKTEALRRRIEMAKHPFIRVMLKRPTRPLSLEEKCMPHLSQSTLIR